ncbi:hypothetical protein ACJ72_01511 [Emergomyces africanus]|uniref:PARP-type domain-containing protein n=1 Tax=Emergomyces africanus TaxID=1955775 RepID=A0A1B7P507_9EURO|nr:hypothetical protein ACJ72_01511 [Emergomyces africanus]
MPTYRIEEASTGRAGCKNKECQEKKEKILKGELRLGSWVDTEQFQSWSWKHWGCVTPRQIASIQEIVGDEKDYTLLDGYDEISAENQEKIREAVEQGHVADSDWKGDVEVNRPGKSGFRVRVSKKKQDPNDDTPQKGKRPRNRKASDEPAEEESGPALKKAKTAKVEKTAAKTAKTSKLKSTTSVAGPSAESRETELPTSLKEKPTKGRKQKVRSEAPAKEETPTSTKVRGRGAKTTASTAAEVEKSAPLDATLAKADMEGTTRNTRRTRSGRKVD